MTKISIVIVNWNVKDLLIQCVESIRNFHKDDAVEIIVIDNASTDGSRDWLNAQSSQPKAGPPRAENLKSIINKENVGFAKANNQGIAMAQGEYILLLNPDTILQEGVLEKTVDFFIKNPECGVLGCKLLNPDATVQPSVRGFPTLASQLFIFLKLHRIFPNLFTLRKYFAKNFDYSKTQEVDQVMGAFFCFPKNIIEKIGLLDEKFFIWFEEVDFCKRVKNAGFKVYYFADASIIHYGAESFKQKLSYDKQKIFNASCMYYFKKHGTSFDALVLKIINPISLLLAYITDLKYHKIISPPKSSDRYKMEG